MNDSIKSRIPKTYEAIQKASEKLGFSMPSDLQTGSLLKTLIASKPKGNFLELGTGTGLGAAWILAGMDDDSKLISIENEAKYLEIAQKVLENDKKLTLICGDAEAWIQRCEDSFDFIFADTWAGKYLELDKAISMLKTGGIYFIDDMLPQPNWPEGHDLKALKLIETLEKREDLDLTKLNWSTGIIIAVKK